MPALLGLILSFLGSAFAKIFTDKVLGYIAMKAILVFLFVTIVPLILNNFLYDIMEILFNFSSSQTSGAGTINGAMSFSGLAGYLVAQFKLPECLSVVVSALTLRVALQMIPFVRVGS